METPLLLIVFNRPDKVRALMALLGTVRPSHLYISADGPRDTVPTDAERCAETRALAQQVSWPCEIHTNFSEVNLGVDPGMESAMSWFFKNVEEGIILEDDCIPDPTFFSFTSELLEKYRGTKEVFMICGTNFQDGHVRGNASYYFSRYPTWGYAMWRRSWEVFDSKLSHFPEFKRSGKIDTLLHEPAQKKFWLSFFRKMYDGKYSFTDTRLLFSMWNAGAVCIIPNVNLVQNIGFGMDATHSTTGAQERSVASDALQGAMTHPQAIIVDRTADDYFFTKIHRVSFLKRITTKIKRMWVSAF